MNRQILIFAAAAALCGGVMGGARADGWSGARMSTGAFAGGTPDYSLLNNNSFDYTDLLQARASGLGDNTIACIERVAEITGMPFSQITLDVLNGETFGDMAWNWGLDLNEINNNQDAKMKIANYVAAYETTGRFAEKNAMGSDMGSPMMPSGMNNSGPANNTPMPSSTMPSSTMPSSTMPSSTMPSTTPGTNMTSPATAPTNTVPGTVPGPGALTIPNTAPATTPDNGTSTNPTTAPTTTPDNGTSTNPTTAPTTTPDNGTATNPTTAPTTTPDNGTSTSPTTAPGTTPATGTGNMGTGTTGTGTTGTGTGQ